MSFLDASMSWCHEPTDPNDQTNQSFDLTDLTTDLEIVDSNMQSYKRGQTSGLFKACIEEIKESLDKMN